MQQKFQKTFLDLEIIAFELVNVNTRFYWEQTVSRFQILLKQNFSSWFPFRVIKKYDKDTAVQI